MAGFLLLMHDDAQEPVADDLRPVNDGLVGFYRITADEIRQAEALIAGNPLFEAGGTIELRDLPKN